MSSGSVRAQPSPFPWPGAAYASSTVREGLLCLALSPILVAQGCATEVMTKAWEKFFYLAH